MQQLQAVKTLAQAFQLRRQGRSDDAEHLCRAFLRQHPDTPPVQNFLVAIALQSGRLEEGLDLSRQVLARHKDDFAALMSCGYCAWRLNQLDLAAESYGRAIALQPKTAEAYFGLARVQSARHAPGEALTALRHAIALKPAYPQAHFLKGYLLQGQERIEDAKTAYSLAIAQRPGYAEALNNLGCLMTESDEEEPSLELFARAIAAKPDYAEAHFNHANTLRVMGRSQEAIEGFRQALGLKPDYEEARINMGVALRDLGHLDEAERIEREVIAANPDSRGAHFNLSQILLLKGEFDEGWREYEWRRSAVPLAQRRADFRQPRWRGESFVGKTLFIHAEQGLGDMINMVRFLPHAARRGGRVILECYSPLARLFKTVEGVTEIVPVGAPPPPFDLHLPMMSLPEALGVVRDDDIPRDIPYLLPDGASTHLWRDRLQTDGRLKAGLVWSGSSTHQNDRDRSIAAARILPVLARTGARLFSLQKDPSATDLATLTAHRDRIVDLSGDLHDFADTAAAMSALDVVIAVDTSSAHMAGALGRPVWLLLPFAPDWRWRLDRADSPWYPTMRIFRQSHPRGWDDVIRTVATELEALAEEKSRAQ